jgi:RNA polymerase sigma-70 factor (ECF subfamily)
MQRFDPGMREFSLGLGPVGHSRRIFPIRCYNEWKKHRISNVCPMSTTETPQNIHEQIVTLLPRLRRFARNLTRNPHDADDVVQIAVERALSRLDQWRSDARLDSWMFKIVRNAWIDELRSRGRRDRIFLAEEAGDHVGVDSTARETELLSVHTAMARLPEEQREAVSLVLVEGLPYKEAADVLDIPIGTLTSRLARGRRALQAMLGEEGEGT